jgi:phytoene/squalene synthetase
MQNLLGQPSAEPEARQPSRPQPEPGSQPPGGPADQLSEDHPDGSWRADALGKSRHARLSDHIREPLDDADPDRADRICAEACRTLLLDFAPALMALPESERRRCHALATYGRMLFDFAAQAGVEGERLAALNRIEFTLEVSLDGEPAGQPAFVAMAAAEQNRPWDRDRLDRLGGLARDWIVWPRTQTGGEAVERSETLGANVAGCLLGEDAAAPVVALAGAMVRLRALSGLGEGIRRDRAGLPVSELPGRGDIDRPLGRDVLQNAIAAELRRVESSLEAARGAAKLVPKPYRRAVRYLRLAARALSRELARSGPEVVSNPPRLGIGSRLLCLTKARLGLA